MHEHLNRCVLNVRLIPTEDTVSSRATSYQLWQSLLKCFGLLSCKPLRFRWDRVILQCAVIAGLIQFDF